MTASIDIIEASLRFKVYANPTPSIKESFLAALSSKKTANAAAEFYALKNITLSFRGGDRVGIIGLNGAGKSTLLKMMVGIYSPQQGSISIRGRVTPLIELGTGFDFELSGRENIYLNGTLLGRSYQEMRQLEKEIIEFAELEDKIDTPLKYYSTGMYGRLAFSIGTLLDAEILLVDEVFSTGDAHFVQKAKDKLTQLMQRSHIMVLVSHELNHIIEFCNKAIVLDKGQIANIGQPREMVNFYLREVARQPELSSLTAGG